MSIRKMLVIAYISTLVKKIKLKSKLFNTLINCSLRICDSARPGAIFILYFKYLGGQFFKSENKLVPQGIL